MDIVVVLKIDINVIYYILTYDFILLTLNNNRPIEIYLFLFEKFYYFVKFYFILIKPKKIKQ